MPDSFKDGEIEGVLVRKLVRNLDSRGWLTELFRSDEMDPEYFPVMSYISSTNPGVTRGPHEHWDQADLFCFLGPSNFKLRVWDNRKDSETFLCRSTLIVGEDNPATVLIPAGVVHAYQNVGDVDGIVINCPNRLYRGAGRKEEVDEIRHEDDGDTLYRMND
jgi:dTDP-4-dehydrorhamnose 3,5-epimerase and related enzymes